MTKTASATAEQFTAAQTAAFGDGVQKTLAALTDVSGQSSKNLEAIVAASTAAANGAGALGAQVMAYSKAAFETQVAALNSLAAAKSPQEAIELQTAFAKTALTTYVAEVGRWSETVQSTLKDALKPLNARVSASVECIQSLR